MDTTDVFATAKANLRDTVKWLATTFAALAAVVLAGSPFSGFGALPPGSARFWMALAGLIGAAVFLSLAWRQLLFLLRSDAVFPNYLSGSYKPAGLDKVEAAEIVRLRQHIVDHQEDLIPDSLDFDGLIRRIQELWNASEEAQSDEKPAALEKWKLYRDNLNMVLNYAAFARLQQRVTSAIPGITVYGLLALVSLTAFAWAANPGKGGEGQGHVTIIQGAASR